MTTTLLLDLDYWDLLSDANGNIALAGDPYRIAQDAASECRLFLGEAWYDTARGIPYWSSVLGKRLSPQTLRSLLTSAALLSPGAVSAKVLFREFTDRVVSGQIQVKDASGNVQVGNF